MTVSLRARQAWTIARIELRRAFFSKRALWVYLLALFPAVIFLGHGIQAKLERRQWAARGLTSAAAIDGITLADTEQEVLKRAGRPMYDHESRGRRRAVHNEGENRVIEEHRVPRRNIGYFDGRRQADIWFENGVVSRKSVRLLLDFTEDRAAFAAIFQYFYLRLAIFFGCLGIFMNLFRGEMLDKTLHFWLLAPARREVLLAGKYLAGLLAAVVIFAGGALLAFGLMLWPHDPAEVQAYWQGAGMSHAFWYATAAALGCLGYGSVFLAAGLLLRNPIVPAAVLLLWEGINGFLPAMLQKLSVLYYLQSLCPVPAPVDNSAPALIRLLLSPAAPASRLWSVAGLVAVTALVLWVASRAVRRLEISYGTE
jgi:ABC-type transport system involved in multi-copper enzyme maturation permease subunit